MGETGLTARTPAPLRFVSAHGRRAWAGGYSNGGLEIWAGALQIASDVRPEFRRAGDVSAIPGSEILSGTTTAPEFVARTYTGPDFSVEERIVAAPDEPAVLISYKVRSARDVRVIVRFQPSVNLMWPAAIGGQTIRWDEGQSAYAITDGAQQFAAEVIVPGATQHDTPLNSPRPLPQMADLAVALAPHAPRVLFVRTKPADAGVDTTEVNMVARSSQWEQSAEEHYRRWLESEVKIDTPDRELNFAFSWAEVALDQDWVCNAELGCGFVGGFGPSRRARRPQYAWYFAGDGMIAADGALAAGDFEHARDELRFIAKYQDAQTGMIWHEITQSAPYLDWRGKYPYMFVHADLTYPYISSVAAYVRRSGDIALLRELWPSVQKAFGFGRSLVGDDGLPLVPEGKEGANEQNPMREELGMSASWVDACADYAYLAGVMQQAQLAQEAHALGERARAAFASRYWDVQRNFPIQGYGQNGQPTVDRGLGAIGAVNEHLFSDEQSGHVLDQIASWRFQSDWGTRSVAMGEPGFDPTAYAHGSVWAFGTAEVAEAYWSAHRPDVAWQIWRTLIPWSMLDSVGHMDEVLAGDTYHPQMESVPEQTWSSAGFLSTAVRGLFGLQVDGPQGMVTFAPHLPEEWPTASLSRVRVGKSDLSLAFTQDLHGLTLRVHNDGEAVKMRYAPRVPLGASAIAASINGRKAGVKVEAHAQDQHAAMELSVPRGDTEIAIRYRGAVEVALLAAHPEVGAESVAMKLTGVALDGAALRVEVDAIPSRENRFEIRTERTVVGASGATVRKLSVGDYEVVLNGGEKSNEYAHREVLVKLQ
jgi:glycogen debranching enzyme